MSVQVGRWPCLHAGDSSPEGCCGFCPLASCSLSLQGVKPQPARLKTKSRSWLERSSSCSPPATAASSDPLHGWEEEGGEISQAGHAGIAKQAWKGNLHTYRLHKD